MANQRVSKRAKSIDSSGIRKVFDLAAKLESPINLSIGQPYFPVPEQIRESAKAAIDSGKNGYTMTQGIPELRAQVRKKYGIAEGEDQEAFITSGVSGGLFLSYSAILDPGDEILIPDPFFCMYRDLALLINAVPTYYDTYPDFKVCADKIAAQVTSKTKAILVNSPGNPTGYALSNSEVDAAIEVAKQHDLWLIYDEIYDMYSYDATHVNCYGKYEKTIILNGFSKSHSVTGWRVGYAVGPKDVVNEMLKIQQYSFVCAPSMAQWALAENFDVDLSPIVSEYKVKRDYIYGELSQCFDVVKPGGAFYIFPKAPGGDGQAFVEKCIENSLLVVPGNVFSRANTHFRISFSANNTALEKGVEILKRLAREYQ